MTAGSPQPDDLLRQALEGQVIGRRVGRGQVDGPFRFTAPVAFVLPSPQPEGHGDKGQGRSPPSAGSAPEVKFGGMAAMPAAQLSKQPEMAEKRLQRAQPPDGLAASGPFGS